LFSKEEIPLELPHPNPLPKGEGTKSQKPSLASTGTAPPFRLAALALGLWSGLGMADCPNWVARLVSAQGQVEVQTAPKEPWHPASPEQRFCPGERLRTQPHSRASVQLADQTFLALDQRTLVVFSHVEADKPSWIDLLKGALFARSRTPKPLEVRTPFINAAIKGTEFMVTAGEGRGEVAVFEGEVEASNAAGKVLVGGGQKASAAPGEAPRVGLTLRPEDAVQWALYFPPLFEAGQQAGDATAAEVARLLSVGRVDEAEPLLAAAAAQKEHPATVGALRSVIALARNRKDEALALSDAAVRADARSAPAWLARSYALQAAFDLPKALEAADKAGESRPNDALIEARRAELLASLDQWAEAHRAADRAVQLDPRQGRALAVKGFAELRDGDAPAAVASFKQAVAADSADPLARLGLGLAAIRRGELRDGTADLELAATLDPGSSLIRSYLGKAYYEQKRNAVAEKQFELAKQFDPKDPTPWLYDAIKKQTENRPVEALEDLDQAIRLNGNRAVYRSKLALDQDLAARSAALGRTYNNLGFGQRALVEGWKSVNADPTNFSAHRLLADTYTSIPGQETARANELLQSLLLQPINSTPIQPHLAESRLLVPNFTGPTLMSFNEFNPVFSRNGFNTQISGLVGNLGTYADEATHAGIWDNFSYNIGQFHYQTQGFRPNNDLKQDILTAFTQAALTPDLSVQAEFRHRELEHGDLFFNGDLKNFYTASQFRRKLNTDTVRGGVRYSPSSNSDVLLSLTYVDSFINTNTFGIPSTLSQRGFLGEAQYIFRHELFDAIAGVGQQSINARQAYQTVVNPLVWSVDLTNAYLYTHTHFPAGFTWTLGVGIDAAHNQFVGSRNQIDPKFGIMWEITPDTTLRLAAFRTYTRGSEVPATIEPTQVAGFNQFFDGYTGTSVWRYGAGLDHRFSPSLLVGAEVSRRDLSQPTPTELKVNPEILRQIQHENQARAYANWAITDRIATRLEYRYEKFLFSGYDIYQNHLVPVGLNYFDPTGISFGTSFTYVNQNYFNYQYGGRGHSSFGLVDLALRYRLPHIYGMASLLVNNLLDHSFNFLGANTFSAKTGRPEETPLFLPDRTIMLQLTLAF
jgi:tetratricopeptide (TPR) repeat protein/opacity protein-like surface antigen